MLTDFKADLLVSQVALGTEAALIQRFLHLGGEFGLLVGDIHDHRLSRCQPCREGTFVVLDQNADEAFEGAEDRPMQHDRMLAIVVFADVFGTKTDRQVEIELQRTALPDTPQAILQRKLDLRTIESTLARLQIVWQASTVERRGQRRFGAIPE